MVSADKPCDGSFKMYSDMGLSINDPVHKPADTAVMQPAVLALECAHLYLHMQDGRMRSGASDTSGQEMRACST